MRILVDTNIILDYILEREPYSKDAAVIFELCTENDIDGCIAAHSVPNLHFILRKYMTMEQRKVFLLRICKLFLVIGIDGDNLVSALENDDFSDYEDCLQAECAKDCNADYIVTRNAKDFGGSAVPVIEPPDFLKMIKQG
jgi:predicted nucleic acid-binding protein